MITSKYTRGSLIHRTLDLISMAPSTKEDLRLKITRESMPRFTQSCIEPLMHDKFIVRKGDYFHITEAGENRLSFLGKVKKQLPQRQTKNWKDGSIYTGKELTMKPVRPGADDHEMHPSLMGNTRYYRNGRVETNHVG